MSINSVGPLDIAGTIHSVGPLDTKNDKCPKRDVVIHVADDKYPDYIRVQFTGDKAHSVSVVGTHVRLSCNVKGRQYKGKDGSDQNFTFIEAWKVEYDAEPQAT